LEDTIQRAKQLATGSAAVRSVAANNGEQAMKFGDTAIGKMFAGLLGQEVKAEGEIPVLPTTAPAPATTTQQPAAPAASSITPELRAVLSEAAEAFCELAFSKNKALPSVLPNLKAEYLQAALDDRLLPVGEGQKTRLALLKERVAATEGHGLTTEKVPDKTTATTARVVTATSNDDEEAKLAQIDEQERKAAQREYERRKETAQARAY